MTVALLTALLSFALVMTVTPGPNNLMLMAAGANFGFRRTMPHMMGISAGVTIMALMVGVGVIALFEAFPLLVTALKIISTAYMLWLAFKLATATSMGDTGTSGRPMTFLQAALFQWVNPKAWAMCLAAVTIYAPDHSVASVAIIAGAFALVSLPCLSVWIWLGTIVRRWLSNLARLRAFNIVMAALLVASLYPVLVVTS